MLTIAEDLKQFEADFNIYFDAKKIDVSLIVINNSIVLGRNEITENAPVELACIREPVDIIAETKNIIKENAFGSDTEADYQLQFLSQDLIDESITEIKPNDYFTFSDLTGKKFKSITRFIEGFPFGQGYEYLKMIYIIEITRKVN